MKRNAFSLLALLLGLVIFNSCKGPVGDPGPMGPQGPKGDPGSGGSSTILSTGWIPVTKQQAISRYDAEGLLIGSRFTGGELDKLSQKILDDGIILVYNRVAGSQSINSVPFTLDMNYKEAGLQLSYYFEALPKEVNCYIQFSKKLADISPYIENEEYRIIIIPGPSGLRMKNIDLKDYEAVKKAFNLKD